MWNKLTDTELQLVIDELNLDDGSPTTMALQKMFWNYYYHLDAVEAERDIYKQLFFSIEPEEDRCPAAEGPHGPRNSRCCCEESRDE
jgi:hypothetical protein